MRDLNHLSATEAARLLASRELSAERLVRSCLARVVQREDDVRAWAYIDPDHVIAQARVLDAGGVRGALHGLPVGVKDIIDTADLPTEYGSSIYKANQPVWDAACVSAIRAAGGIIMGKTVTAELATSHRGKTRHPHNPAHTPGGSSSGSAAAVADYMVPLALGTQTGGSTIRPSSFCGIVGYKPSFGFINRHGVKPVSETLDTVGLLARSVADVALLAAAVTGRRLNLEPCSNPPRVGVWRTYEWKLAAPETVAALETTARRVAAGGAWVREAAMPELLAEITAAHSGIQGFEMARTLSFEMRYHREKLSASLQATVEKGMKVTPETYDQKQKVAADCRRLMDDVFRDFDFLLAPSAPGEAPEGLESTGNAVFNRPWTLLGVPCVTVPAGVGPRGLPVGVQVIGRYGDDAKTFSYADWVRNVIDAQNA